MMRIAFDLDGVLYDWHTPVWEKYFSDDYSYDDFWKFAWKDIEDERWPSILSDQSMYINTVSAELVNMMHKLVMRYHIFYVTLRTKDLEKVTRSWMRVNGFPELSHLIFAKESKVPVCKELEIDLVIEDRIEIMDDLANNGIEVIGVKQPWNEARIEDFPYVDNVLRLEREIARIDATKQAHRRRNGSSQ